MLSRMKLKWKMKNEKTANALKTCEKLYIVLFDEF